MPTVGPFPYGNNIERWDLGLPCWELPTFCPANPKTGQVSALPFVRPRAEMGIGAAPRGVASNGGISSWQPPAAAGGWDGASRAAPAPALVQLHPPITLSFPSPVPTVRSPPGLAKTPLSALGLKPHNPAEILLHPVGGECRAGAAGGFLLGTSVRSPLGGSRGWRRRFLPPCFGQVALGTLSLPIGIWGRAEQPPSRGGWKTSRSWLFLTLPPPSSFHPLSSQRSWVCSPAIQACQPEQYPEPSPSHKALPVFFFFVACRVSGSRNLRGGSSLGCSLVPTPNLGSGRHLWGAQVGRWRCRGRRGALLGSPRAVSARQSCLTRVSLSLCLTPLFHLCPPPSLRARRGGGSCLCGR